MLSTTDQKLMANLTTARPMPRKNLWIVIAVVNSLRDQKQATVTSKNVEQIIDKLGLRDRWDSDSKAKDTYGLQKAIGDLLGGHGLKLAHQGRGKGGFIFVIPRDGVTEDYIRSIGLDPADVEEQALVPGLVQSVIDRHIILFRYSTDPAGAAYRRFSPHIYYKGKTMPMVAGVQTGGYSNSEAKANADGKTTPLWRIFQADKMVDVRPTKYRFHLDPSYKPENYKDVKVFARADVQD